MKTIFITLLVVLGFCQAQESEIRAAMKAQLESPYLRTSMDMTSDGKASKMMLEYVAPDRYHMVSPDMNMIIISDTTYQKMGDAWQVLPMNMGSMISQFRTSELMDQMTLSNTQKLPDETIEGKTYSVYSYTTVFETITSQNKLWVDQSTGLPFKSEVSSDFSNISSTVNSFYDYSTFEILEPVQ